MVAWPAMRPLCPPALVLAFSLTALPVASAADEGVDAARLAGYVGSFVYAGGEDEEQAVAELARLVRDRFGEQA